MRITTNAILRNYKSNLATSMTNMDLMRTRVMTGRQFNSTAENPAAALRAANLERKYVRNQDYISSVQDAQSYQDAQEDGARQINELAKTLSKQYGLEALNGTNGALDIRKTYADAWRGARDSMLLSLNSTYEGKYVFAGNNGMKAPFSLDADGNLLYRNTKVDDIAEDDPLLKETDYIDLGFGLDKNGNGEINPSSAFDRSLPGIKLVGYGKTGENPNNMLELAGKIADCLESEDFDYSEYKNLLNAFDAGRDNVLEQVTNLGTKTQFLSTTKDRLETNELNLSTQLDNVVNVDMAEAIMNYSWAQYAYNASLKVGNSILSPSFIDFMR